MKKIVIVCLIAALGLLAACENTIRYEYDSTDGQITILSQMYTSQTEHSIVLSMSYPDRVDSLPGATVVCYVNDARYTARQQPVPLEEYYWYDPASGEVLMEMRPRQQKFTEYRFSARIQPGDEVRVEASKGSLKAWAQVTVPQPARLVKVDTATVVRTVNYTDLDGSYTWEDTFLDVSATIRDVPGVDSYFTLTASSLTEGEIRSYAEDGSVEDTEAYYLENADLRYETFHDKILEDGFSAGEGNGFLSELLPTNEMHCFSDKEFRDGEATVHPSFEADRLYPIENGTIYWSVPPGAIGEFHTVFRVHLRTIDRAFYNYLRAINNMETYGYDVTPIIEPTMLPCNVTGGFGMVSVAADETVVFDLGTSIVDRRDDDPLYY